MSDVRNYEETKSLFENAVMENGGHRMSEFFGKGKSFEKFVRNDQVLWYGLDSRYYYLRQKDDSCLEVMMRDPFDSTTNGYVPFLEINFSETDEQIRKKAKDIVYLLTDRQKELLGKYIDPEELSVDELKCSATFVINYPDGSMYALEIFDEPVKVNEILKEWNKSAYEYVTRGKELNDPQSTYNKNAYYRSLWNLKDYEEAYRLAGEFESSLAEQSMFEAAFLYQVDRFTLLLLMHHYEAAYSLGLELYQVIEGYFTEENIEFMLDVWRELLSNLAFLMFDRGDYGNASMISFLMYNECLERFGPTSEETWKALKDYSVYNLYNQRTNSSFDILKMVYKMHSVCCGNDPYSESEALYNISLAYSCMRDYDTAVECDKKLLNQYRNAYGLYDIRTLDIINSIGWNKSLKENSYADSEAKELVLTSYQWTKRTYPDDPGLLADFAYNTGVALYNQSHSGLSQKVLKEAEEYALKSYGENSDFMMKLCRIISKSIRSHNRNPIQAIPYGERAMKIASVIYGVGSDEEHISLIEYCRVLIKTGKSAEVIPLAAKALLTREKKGKLNSRISITLLRFMREIFNNDQKGQELLMADNSIWKILTKLVGENDPETMHSLRNIVVDYLDIGNIPMALEVSKTYSTQCREIFGTDSEEAVDAADLLFYIQSLSLDET